MGKISHGVNQDIIKFNMILICYQNSLFYILDSLVDRGYSFEEVSDTIGLLLQKNLSNFLEKNGNIECFTIELFKKMVEEISWQTVEDFLLQEDADSKIKTTKDLVYDLLFQEIISYGTVGEA